MIKLSRIILCSIALLVLGAIGPASTLAKGPPVKVTEAIPNTATQGDEGKLVTLKGKGFENDPGNTVVQFKKSSNGALGLIIVGDITFDSTTGYLEFPIDVPLGTDPVEYDIEVEFMSSGRRGKGTTLFSVLSQGQGGGKGGAGEDGTACYTFEINEEISHDGNAEYCHGDDGQATVPSRFRIDLKKFNGNARQIFLDPICSGDDGELGTVDDVVNCFPGAAVAFQSQSEVLSDGSFNGELQFPDMRIANGPTRVTLSILFVEKHVKLHFGNDQSGVRCPESTLTGPTGPVWVKCTGESATTGSCNSWTLSTRDLSTNPVPDPARACLIHWKRELVTLDPVVEADFEFSISVIE